MSDGGKGSKARPLSVPKEEFDERFDIIFRKKTTEEEFDERVIMKNEYFETEE
jgi:hypothetical protein